MLFKQRFWEGLEDGSVTVAVRRWKRPSVRAGGTMQSPGGLLAIDSVELIEMGDLTETDARKAGYSSLDELLGELESRAEGYVYRVAFRRIGEDPRIALRNSDRLSAEDVAQISARLDRLDASSEGAWTRSTLDLIEMHPARRAADLAAIAGRETQPFKIDVRKLKAMGLTESLEIGYRLSPRGVAYRNVTRS